MSDIILTLFMIFFSSLPTMTKERDLGMYFNSG